MTAVYIILGIWVLFALAGCIALGRTAHRPMPMITTEDSPKQVIQPQPATATAGIRATV